MIKIGRASNYRNQYCILCNAFYKIILTSVTQLFLQFDASQLRNQEDRAHLDQKYLFEGGSQTFPRNCSLQQAGTNRRILISWIDSKLMMSRRNFNSAIRFSNDSCDSLTLPH